MKLLTVDEIKYLHTKLTAKTGGSDGVRDMGLLESAVFSAKMSFADSEVYPTAEEKAARLMFSLVSNHAFIDGNKRIGVLIMLMTLKMNGISLNFTQAELIDLGLTAAEGKMKYEDILAFINSHKK